MTEVGKREANKRATHAALEQAARRLFAERGFAATTVRDIADAAGVTERTFFRYFAGKEELILDDVLAGLPALQEIIRARPAHEPPLIAIVRAVQQVGAGAGDAAPRSPLLLFLDGRPVQRVGPSATGFLLRVEGAIADAVRDRLIAAGQEDVDYQAELVSRLALAVIRSALIQDVQLREADVPSRPSVAELLDQAVRLVATSVGSEIIAPA